MSKIFYTRTGVNSPIYGMVHVCGFLLCSAGFMPATHKLKVYLEDPKLF